MQIISWNVCGFRSVCKKGFSKLKKYNPDIICLQEIKVMKGANFPLEFLLSGYELYINPARFHGTAILTKIHPLKIRKEIGHKKFDSEGRFIRLDFEDFILINVYMPHGGRHKERMDYKLECYEFLLRYLESIADQKVILAGDFNIAHKSIDLARPEQNVNNTMFTKEERKMIDRLLMLGFIDSFRKFNRSSGYYTWWPRGHEARKRNIGWRIDYIFISKNLENKLKNAFILSDIEGSDHCPVGVEVF